MSGPQPYPCPRCSAAIPIGAATCPACGWVRDLPLRKAARHTPTPPGGYPVAPAPDAPAEPPRKPWWAFWRR